MIDIILQFFILIIIFLYNLINTMYYYSIIFYIYHENIIIITVFLYLKTFYILKKYLSVMSSFKEPR